MIRHAELKIRNAWSLRKKALDVRNVTRDTKLTGMVDVSMLMSIVGISPRRDIVPIATDCIS